MTGIAHQGDSEGREIIRKLHELAEKELAHTLIFLPIYSTTVSKLLTSGCDLWLNTPVIGSEACGTSGMKASLNGVLQGSTKDGWLHEVDISSIGWELNSQDITESIMYVIQNEIVREYYSSDRTIWEEKMRNARSLIQNKYSATRMVREYFEKLYLPIITTSYSHYFS
jgi:starch phosphorylase